MAKRNKVELEDIIGIVKTDEVTNSVELKKEVYNDVENQFKFDRDTVATNLKTPIVYDGERMSIGEVLGKLNELNNENKELYNFNLHTINQELQEENNRLKLKNNRLKQDKKEIIEAIDGRIKGLEENIMQNKKGTDYNWNVVLCCLGMIDVLNNLKKELQE